jgi:hypothetical protein
MQRRCSRLRDWLGRQTNSQWQQLFARRPDAQRCKRADFERAMEALFIEGEIINVPYGPSDPRYRITRNRHKIERTDSDNQRRGSP